MEKVKAFAYLHIRKIIAAFFVMLFLGGSLIYRDYGISFDELMEYKTLIVNVNYVAKKLLPPSLYEKISDNYTDKTDLKTYVDREYGVAAHFPSLIITETAKRITNIPVNEARHYYVFLVFFCSLICLYQMIRRLTGKRRYALLGVLLLLRFLLLRPV